MEVDIYIISQPNFGDDRLYRVSQAPKRAWPALSVAFIESSYKRLGTARLGLDSNRSVWGEHIPQSCASVQTPNVSFF